MPIADPGIGIFVIILGLLLIVGGIVVAAVVYREGRVMKEKILPLLDALDMTGILPEGWESVVGLIPFILAFVRDILLRVFMYIDIVGLLGGAAISVVGVIVFLMGLFISS